MFSAMMRRIAKSHRRVHPSLLFFFLLIVPSLSAHAERLPIKTYTTADGLARDSISRIVRDSHGFLWFCTSEGLSRFDGYKFTNYGLDQGLPSRVVNDLLETRGGVYWVATNNGLCRFNPDAATQGEVGSQSRFTFDYQGEETRDHIIEAVIEDHSGVVWCGGFDSFYRLDQKQGQWVCSGVDLGLPATGPASHFVARSLIEDHRGALWINASSGLYRRRPDGRIEHFTAAEGLPAEKLSSAMLEDRAGRIWVGAGEGLCQLVPEPTLNAPAVERVYTTRDGLADNSIKSLFQAADGKLWVSSGNVLAGLSMSLPSIGQGGMRFRSYTKAQGLSGAGITSMAEDREGNLWLGTESGGAIKIASNGFTTYDEADGLGALRISTLLINQSGELYAIGVLDTGSVINRFDGQRFEAVELRLPTGITYWGWGWYQTMFQTRLGEWWMQTGQGLVRYPPLERLAQLTHARPRAIYTQREGLAEKELFRIYEDSRGDIWIGTVSYAWDTLTRWDRRTEAFHRFTAQDGLPPGSAPTAFGEDASGNLWIGFYLGGLARYAAGRLTMFTTADGLPAGLIRGIYLDHASRLWVATGEGGAARIDDPQAEHPPFIVYNTANGLSSNQASAITEDQWGRIYIGTGRGVDRLDPASGHIKHYTTADGLASNFVNVALRDREGALWFGTLQGLSRLIPEPDRPTLTPPTLISALRVAGVSYPISDLGAAEVAGLELSASRNQIQIDFVGLSLGMGEALRYQYKLEGADRDWSALTEQRTVNYPNLAPGTYNFLVRAVTADGTLSEPPATVSFKIFPPIWQRWWFLTIAAALIAAASLAFARYRAARVNALRESENRFRTLAQTASDAIITIDEESRIVYINQAAEKVFGYTQQEMTGAELPMLMPESFRHLHRAGFARYRETGKRHIAWEAIELPGLHKNGSQIPLEVSFGEFTKDGRRYFTGIARDITERKRAEEAIRKSREERLAELERVRTRIATDLHDDIGSSLTQISILSEVAQQRIGTDDSQLSAPLSLIAGASRELVDSMSDIVWAINPQKDHLNDLTQRMRRFASDVLTARNIAFEFREPDEENDVQLGANIRREVFLIFKESVNNLVRHSACTEAEIDFRIAGGTLELKVRDNGKGFDTSQDSEGHGLSSMRQRAEGIGGRLEMISSRGVGTTVTLEMPLAGSA
jgi:PAS domain S-box-containing protein